MKRKTFKKRYDFTCPKCGMESWAAPSMMMTEFGNNSGHGGCLECETFLYLEIEGGLDGEKMLAVEWNKFLENRKKIKTTHNKDSRNPAEGEH